MRFQPITPPSLFKKFFFGSLTALLLLLSACGDYPTPALQSNATILAFGDSLTAGYGVKTSQSYPAQLQKQLSQKVINAGISGETTNQGKARFSQTLEKYQPDLVILTEGGNDFLKKIPKQQTYENLLWMVETAKAKDISVLLVGVPTTKLFSSSHDLYQQLSDATQTPLEDDILPSLMFKPSMKSDYVHFNQQGYAAMAEAVYQKLVAIGAVSKIK